MLAARLHDGEHRLRLEQVEVPEPRGNDVLVRVAGAGVCRSDLHVLDGLLRGLVRLPVTMGHEIAGWVEKAGPEARGVDLGEPVAVMVGWGCGYCEQCVGGHEQLCAAGIEAGSTADGGFAEFVLVPHRRHLVPLGELDPVTAAPLGDAALSAYAAVKRVRPYLQGAAAAVVVGAGGLGQHAIQLLGALAGASVIAVDVTPERLALARALGAGSGILAGPDAAAQILDLARGHGAGAVIDFVGSDESLSLAARIVAPRGAIALVGLAGGTLPVGFFTLAAEASLTTVHAGTILDLHEVVALAQRGVLSTRVTTYPLEAVNEALDDLRAGRVEGRAVVTPPRRS